MQLLRENKKKKYGFVQGLLKDEQFKNEKSTMSF